MNLHKLDNFTLAYLECAIWSSTDDSGNPLDDDYGIEDIDPNCLSQMVEDCRAFQSDNSALLSDLDDSQCGHDFWLTRNRHGAGFWDRGLGDVGQKLTEASHAYGSCDLIVGDDSLIYCT
jgi:hypothetical protein